MIRRLSLTALALAPMAGCGPSYSPNIYSANAVQQANKVEQGVIVGVRPVAVTAAGTVGTVTGAAAGGIAGSQAMTGPISAFTALGGSLVGGIAGSAVEHTVADTSAFEYIVRKGNGDLVSVTQNDKAPLALGQKVLVIAGNQARVVPDYTVPPTTVAANPAKPADVAKTDPAPAETKPAADAQPADTKSVDSAPADTKSAETKTAGTPPALVIPTVGAKLADPAPANP